MMSLMTFGFCLHLAIEWVGPTSDERNVKVKFDRGRKKIHVEDMRRKPLRMLDLRAVKQKVHYRVASDGLQNLIAVRVQGDIDLVRVLYFIVFIGISFSHSMAALKCET